LHTICSQGEHKVIALSTLHWLYRRWYEKIVIFDKYNLGCHIILAAKLRQFFQYYYC